MTKFALRNDGVRIAYEIVGEGEPVVLVHGFASDRVQNWRAPGWYQTLNGAGYQVVALDCRGHGESDKPHDPAKYGHATMADDVAAVIQDAGVGQALLMGYSMGGYISMSLLIKHPELFRKVVIAGGGASSLDLNAEEPAVADPERRSAIADALLVDDISTITNETARNFRLFPEQPGKD